MNSNIGYTGKVKLTLDNNKFSYHNNGLPNLFRLICRGLAGNNITNEIPEKVDLRYSNDDDNWQSCLINSQFLTQINYTLTNGSWVLKTATSIPYSELNVTPLSALGNVNFRLYLMSNNEDLAFVNINKSDILLINPGSQALVEWVLCFSNID